MRDASRGVIQMADWVCNECAEADEETYADGEYFEGNGLECERCGRATIGLTRPRDTEGG